MEELNARVSQGQERSLLYVHNEPRITNEEGEKLTPLDDLRSSEGHGFIRGIHQKCYDE